MLPLARVNLRAPLRKSISISDASERGGASAEAESFLPSLDASLGERIADESAAANEAAGRRKQPDRSSFCGVCTVFTAAGVKCGPGCNLAVCSADCYWIHRKRACPRICSARLAVGFACLGSDPGWTWELLSNQLEVVKVGFDSKSLTLPSVVVVSLRFSAAARRAKSPSNVRAERQKVKALCVFLEFLLAAGKRFLLLHPHQSMLWECRDWERFLATIGVSCIEIGDCGEAWAVHNFVTSVSFSGLCLTGSVLSVACISEFVRRAVLPECSLLGGEQFPCMPEDRAAWLYNQLIKSTRGFSHNAASSSATKQICDWLKGMKPGSEAAHIESLYRFLDLRGSDVRLDMGAVLSAGRQTMPYPAFAWDWGPLQSYAWSAPQHINVSELIACFNYLRGVIQRYSFGGLRFVHVVDSMVTAAVLTKGRSSSKVLNRTLRRIAALQLAGDLYIVPVWTISAWNFSDHGSRFIRPRPGCDAASA